MLLHFKKLHTRSLYFWLVYSLWGDTEAEFQSLDVAVCAGCESSRSQFSFALDENTSMAHELYKTNIYFISYSDNLSKLLSLVRHRGRGK